MPSLKCNWSGKPKGICTYIVGYKWFNVTIAEPSAINCPGYPFLYSWLVLIKSSTKILLLKTCSYPVKYPVDFWIKYLNHELPDPG